MFSSELRKYAFDLYATPNTDLVRVAGILSGLKTLVRKFLGKFYASEVYDFQSKNYEFKLKIQKLYSDLKSLDEAIDNYDLDMYKFFISKIRDQLGDISEFMGETEESVVRLEEKIKAKIDSAKQEVVKPEEKAKSEVVGPKSEAPEIKQEVSGKKSEPSGKGEVDYSSWIGDKFPDVPIVSAVQDVILSGMALTNFQKHLENTYGLSALEANDVKAQFLSTLKESGVLKSAHREGDKDWFVFECVVPLKDGKKITLTPMLNVDKFGKARIRKILEVPFHKGAFSNLTLSVHSNRPEVSSEFCRILKTAVKEDLNKESNIRYANDQFEVDLSALSFEEATNLTSSIKAMFDTEISKVANVQVNARLTNHPVIKTDLDFYTADALLRRFHLMLVSK